MTDWLLHHRNCLQILEQLHHTYHHLTSLKHAKEWILICMRIFGD